MRQGSLDDLAPEFQGALDGGLQRGELPFDLRVKNDGHGDARPTGRGVPQASHVRPTNQNHGTGPWWPAASGPAGLLGFPEFTPDRAHWGKEKTGRRTLAGCGARNE